MALISKLMEQKTNFQTYHAMVGFGSPTHLHSKVIFAPSSVCRITGRSVNVGLIPSSGTGASSPSEFSLKRNDGHGRIDFIKLIYLKIILF